VNRHIIEADLIVLATGVIPRKDAAHVARVLNISQKHNGFFLEAHPKLRPMDSFTDGIFLAGCCQSPRDIPDSVAQATGAASHACSILSKKEIEIEPIFCVVDYKKCIRCGMCIDFCPYGALILEEELKVIEVICKGCGACVANCPTGALEQIHFKDDQIISQIEGLFKWR
jgi:heterodisulfide reductase subunit A